MMSPVPYAYLALSVFGVLCVATAYRPVRREPVSVLSFAVGWPVGELAVVNVAVAVAVTVVFAVFGALGAWAGYLGLGLTALGVAGLCGLAVAGRRDGHIVAEAVCAAFPAGAGAPPAMPAPEWGRWGRTTRALPFWSRHAEVVKNIDYWGDGTGPHRLDIVRLRRGVEGAPVLVYIHGGAWVIGDKREQGKPMMNELVHRGWVCATINYRLSPKATWPDQIVDCKRAIAWVRRNIADYGGDPSFIALSGGSAGGQLAALAALTAGDPEWQPGFETENASVDACVPFYGVMDMTGDPSTSGLHGTGLVGMLERRVMKVTATEQPEVFRRASPTLQVNAAAPPFFVLQGGNDTLVPVEVARQFVEALRRASAAPVAYAELPLAQHAFDVLASLRCQATTAGVIAFLDAVRDRTHAPRPEGTVEGPPARTQADGTGRDVQGGRQPVRQDLT
jgi:acetyl esterase/lipase